MDIDQFGLHNELTCDCTGCVVIRMIKDDIDGCNWFLAANGTPIHTKDCTCEDCIEVAYVEAIKSMCEARGWEAPKCDCGGASLREPSHAYWCSTNTSIS